MISLAAGTQGVWEDCEVVFPTGRGVMSAGSVVFINTKFEATRGMQFSKSAGVRDVLINCTLPVNSDKNPVAWVRGKTPPRPTIFALTYHCKDADGKPAVIMDGSEGDKTFAYTREISDQEALAFNPWNLLRGNDNWDPSGTKDKYEAAGQGSLIYRLALTNANASIRTGGQGAQIGATVTPPRGADRSIKWSTTSDLVTLTANGANVTVTGKNAGTKPEYVPVTATAANGAYLNAWVFVEPKYIDPPKLTSAPKVNAPVNGKVSVSYTLDLGTNEDQSVISWHLCTDNAGSNAREIATSRGNIPMKEYTLSTGDIGKFLRVSVQPKHQISDPGQAVVANSEKAITAEDVGTTTVDPNFRNFVVPTTTSATYTSGSWTFLGTWTTVADDAFLNGYGVRVASKPASMLFQQDGDFGDMQLDIFMTPEKTEGMGFGSPGSAADGDNNQKSDIFIKYDPRTRTGYSLRLLAHHRLRRKMHVPVLQNHQWRRHACG